MLKPGFMKKHIAILLFIGLLILPVLSYAQFTVSAELRPRAEMDNGKLRPIPDSLDTRYYITQRTRLKFDFNKEKYQLRLSIQDVRFWGNGDIYSATGVWGSTAGLDIQEAWFKLRFGKQASLTIGRQVLKLDDMRLIANRNWNQYGISYDAVSFMFNRNNWFLTAAVSYNTNTDLDNGRMVQYPEFFGKNNIMKTQNFIHLKRKFSKNFSASVVAIASGYQHSTIASTIYMMATYGLWWKFDNGKFDIMSNMYMQSGKGQSGKGVMAYMLTLHPGIKFGKVRIGIGGDYLSGDNAENDNYGEKEKTFNTMYGIGFKYYGYMNYYTYMKASTANGGLIDIYPNIKIPINEKHILMLAYHAFYLANPVVVKSEVIDNTDMGSEFDLMYTYKILPELTLQAGASHYITTETFKKVKGVNGSEIRTPYWVWTMITFTPELFKSK